MKRTTNHLTPHARQERLVIEEIPDEVLVYDLDRKKAHCLNRAAALVWKHCDGRTTVADIALSLEHELNTPMDEPMIWLALSQLDKACLLREPLPQAVHTEKLSRREVIKRAGLAAAVSLPLITSLLAPTSSQAASCLAPGQPCAAPPMCCSNGQPGGGCNTGLGKCK